MARHLRLTLSGILMPIIIGLAFSASGQTITSVQDGPWNDPNTWDSNPTIPNSGNSTSIVILHNVTIPNGFSVSIDQAFVDIGGTLSIASGGTVTVENDTGSDLDFYNDGFDYGFLSVSGLLILNNSATITGTDAGNANFNSGGVYRHMYTTTEGSIPQAFWDFNSTVQIQGYTGTINASGGGNWNQSFGNLAFSCNLGNSSVNFAGLLTSIQNTLTISGTGSGTGSFRFASSQNPTINIGRDLIISGSSRVLFGTGTSTTVNIGRNFEYNSTHSSGSNLTTGGTTTLNIAGNFSQNGTLGNLILSSSGSGNGILDITGNFSIDAGTLTFSTGASGGTIKIGGNFATAISTSVTANGSSTTSNLNFTGAAFHTFSNSGAITGPVNYSIESLSTLDVGTSVVAGGGSFLLNGKLQLGSTDLGGALQLSTSAGNIQTPTGTRIYASGSTIVYNGSGAQFIGNGFPSGGDVNLSINNPSNVTLSTSLDIVALRTLNLISGNIVIGTQTLTINGTVTGSGGIVGGASSKMVIGGTGNFGTLNFSGSNQLLDFTMNRTSSGLVTLGDNLEILGTLTQTEGELDLNGNTLTIGGAFARSFGTLGVDAAASIIINGSGVLPSGSTGITGASLGTLTMNRSGATLDASASVEITNLNLTSGTLNNGSGLAMASGGTITRAQQGAMTASPNNTTNAYNVVYNTTSPISSGPELPSNTTALANLTKLGSGTLTLASDITVNGILTFSSGTFNSGANDLNLKGNLVSNAASVLTGSNVTFSGTSIISGSTPPVFGGIIVTGTLTPSANFNINGDLTNNGTLNAGSATVTFGGTTNFLGAGPYNFNNVSITGILNAPTTMSVAGNWSNSGTFNRGLASNNVTFNGTTSFTGPGTTTFSSITITGTLNSSATLRVAGNFTNNGTFVAGTGTLLLNGTSVQSLAGTTTTTFNNITVTNNANPLSVQVQSNQNIRGILTLSSNTIFDADGSGNTSIFTLLSSADDPSVTDAAIAGLPSGAQVTGNVTVQRYMSIEGGSNSPAFNNGRIYRYISSPVASAPVSQIQNFIPVTGPFTGSSSCSGCSSTQTMFLYNESELTDTNASGTADLNDGYESFPQTINTETLTTGRGYSLLVRGNVAPISSAGNALWSVRNPINSGIIDFVATAGVSYTVGNGPTNDGWNLVGNPYPSTIDWDAASGWTRTGINDAIYMKDNGSLAGTYATYINGTEANGGSRYIPMGQAFWVKAISTPTFQATEAVKAPGNVTTFFRTSPPSDLMRVTLRSGLKRDEIIVYFDEDATEEFDGSKDAYKLQNDIFNLSTVTPLGDKLAINGLPKLGCNKLVGLNITNVSVGSYQLDFTEFESFETPVNILLHDKLIGQEIDVTTLPSYEFQVTDQESSYKDRFNLEFVNRTIDPTLLVTDTKNGTGCNNGSVVISAEGAPVGGGYKWYEGENDMVSIEGQNGSQFETPLLEKSKTYFVSIVNEAGCEGPRTPVVADVITFDQVNIIEEGNTLTSTYQEGNQWFKDGELIPGATEKDYQPEESGIYKVEVSIESCKTSSERAYTVTEIESDLMDSFVQSYPNPVSSMLTIRYRNESVDSPRILDVNGRNVGGFILKQDGDFTVGTFDFRGFADGVYLLQIANDKGKIFNKRIFKK